MNCRVILSILCAIVFIAPGCNVGKDNVVFVTRNNLALDLDSSPPTVAIGFKRDELVLEPRDENGRTLPVLTTVATKTKFLDFEANHSFATGDAAIIMAKYLTSPAKLSSTGEMEIPVDDLETRAADGTAIKGNAITNQGRERIVFTTNTSLGLEVSWNEASIPTAVSLGFKRKEFAFVPLAQDTSDATKSYLVPLLATGATSASANTRNETGIKIGQTFATGLAATLMASHPEVRQALGPSIIPEYDEIQKLMQESERKNIVRVQKVQLLETMMTGLETIPDEAQSLISELDSADWGADLTFIKFQWSEQNSNLISNNIQSALSKPAFKEFIRYYRALDTSIRRLDAALSNSNFTENNKKLPSGRRNELQGLLNIYKTKRDKLDERLRKDRNIDKAVAFYIRALTGGN